MMIIDLETESVTLAEVIELAREDPVSIITTQGEEVYVTHLRPQAATLTEAETENPTPGAMTQEEVDEAIEEELARLEASALPGEK
jgi:hypothetical protein